MPGLVTKDGPDGRERISPKLKTALDLMVFGDQTGKPLDWDVAAKAVNISTQSMRRSLQRLSVRQYLARQGQVFRACIGAKSFWHLDQIASQRTNMNAAVAAVRAVLGHDEPVRSASSEARPWLTIKIVAAEPPSAVVEHSPPVIEHEPRQFDPNDPLQELPEPRSRELFRTENISG
jgi:hypothetical protein